MNEHQHLKGKNDVHDRPVDINKLSMSTLLTVDDVAKWLNISPRTIRDWVYRKKIPHIKVHSCLRFDPEVIRLWLEGGGCGNSTI